MLREFLIVIAAVAKVSFKHGLWLVARVNQNSHIQHQYRADMGFT